MRVHKEVDELENDIAENTTNVRHCNTTEDCYNIFRDPTIKCVVPSNLGTIKTREDSYGTCQHQGCHRSNNNCYAGELCIKNRCVPVSEVRKIDNY